MKFAGNCVGTTLGLCVRPAFLALYLRPGECIFEGILFRGTNNAVSFRRLVFNVGFERINAEVHTAQISRHNLRVIGLEIYRLCWVGEPLRRACCTKELRAMNHHVGVNCEAFL